MYVNLHGIREQITVVDVDVFVEVVTAAAGPGLAGSGFCLAGSNDTRTWGLF